MTLDYRVGDTREIVAGIPDGSVALIATSPPFLALRSYLPAGHDAKHAEIGSEATPAAFLDTLLALTAEWGRVLAPWGSIAVELGDTYSGSGGAGGDYGDAGLRAGQMTYKQQQAMGPPGGRGPRLSDRLNSSKTGNKNRDKRPGWPLDKSLALIPEAYALSLAYGYNVLRRPMSAVDCLMWIDALRATGMSAEAALANVGSWVVEHPEPSPAGRWRVRNIVCWHRPNPAVGALGDKVRPSTSYITIATRSAKRWFDLDAVRGEGSPNTHARLAKGAAPRFDLPSQQRDGNWSTLAARDDGPAGAPPLDCWFDEYDGTHETWTLTTQPSKLAHYAMWPAKLAERLVLMMCPAEVCAECGEPRRRITKYDLDSYRTSSRPQTQRAVALADRHGLTEAHIAAVRAFGTSDAGKAPTLNNGAGKNTVEVQRLASEAKSALGGYFREFVMSTNAVPTSTWTDCGHGGQWTRGVVLDPFAGTATTGLAAEYHGRDAICIDLDPRNAELVPLRREEVRRALNPTHVEQIGGQMSIFGESA